MKNSFFILLISVIQINSCKTSSSNVSSSTNSINLLEIGNNISNKFGNVVDTFNGKSNNYFILFQESHTILKEQIEIAAMINRLYHDFNLKYIGLEGAFYSPEKITPDWKFDKALSNEKIATSIQLLKEGEINCAEFNLLVNPDINVFGIENENEFNIKDQLDISFVYDYLLQIAIKGFNQSDTTLMSEITSSKSHLDGVEKLLNSNTFTKEYLSKIDSIHSIEEEINVYESIQKKANKVDAMISNNNISLLNDKLTFLYTASKRSRTMIKHAIDLANISQDNLSIVIGAGHTKKMTKLLRDRDFSYLVISANSFGNDTATRSSYKMKLNKLSVDNGILGSLLNNDKKPPLTINENWLKCKANLYALTLLIARKLKNISSKEKGDLLKKLKDLETEIAKLNIEDVEIDYNSFSIENGCIVFNALIKPDPDLPFKSIWVKTQQIIDDETKNVSSIDEIELLLKEAIVEIDTQTKKLKDIGKDAEIIKIIGTDTWAAFALSKEELSKIEIKGF